MIRVDPHVITCHYKNSKIQSKLRFSQVPVKITCFKVEVEVKEGAEAGAEISSEPEAKPDMSKMAGSGNPDFNKKLGLFDQARLSAQLHKYIYKYK